MVTIKHITLTLSLAFSLSTGHAGPADSERVDRSSRFAQSAAVALARDFPSRDISFLLLDAQTGRLLASRWEHPEEPIPVGSLLKPFTALAYGEHHDFRYPSYRCRGASTRCWLPRGHGDLDVTAAIAQSCNSYFRMLTADLTAADVLATATRFGLDRPSSETSGPELAGLGTGWRTSPLHIASAYLELVRQRRQPGVSQLLDGMALSAQQGTGAELHRAFPSPGALVKTGTAACTHSQAAPGDGFAVVLTPADDPKTLLMVRVHRAPGAQAAMTAGQMLRRIEE
jgi:cell division protein FtsI/penicillin-binding protein 2